MKDKIKNLLVIILAFCFILSLSITAFAEIPIYCPHCKVHLYNYQKDEITAGVAIYADDFKPAGDDTPQPTEGSEMVCPLCGSPLNGYEWFAWERKMPSTKLVYPAVNLLTKDKDGNFKFVPYDLEIEDWEGKY